MAADDQKGWQWQYAKPGPYATSLNPQDEQGFQQWVSQNKIPWQDSPSADYDMRGYYKAMKSGDPLAARAASNQHFPDKWKTPYHQSFSNESMYSQPGAPAWKENQLIDPSGKVLFDENAPQPQKKVVKVGDHVVAFPGHFDDSRINNAIKAFRAQQQPIQPTAAQIHTRDTNPHFAPMQTDSSEAVRQSGGATPQLPPPSRDNLRQYVQEKTEPVDTTKVSRGALGIGLTNDYALNTIKRAGRMLFGMADFPVQMAQTIPNLFSDDPNVSSEAEGQLLSAHPGAMVSDRIKELQSDWQKSKALAGTNLAGDALGFYLGGKINHGIESVPFEETPPRANTRPVISNSIGDLRIGTDGVPTVWLSPKGWDAWMKVSHPEENPAQIHGMSVRADDALRNMFSSQANPTPEWLQVQHLVNTAHDMAQNSNAYAFLKRTPDAHVNVLPEEKYHTYQRNLATNGLIRTHLPEQSFNTVAAAIPEPTRVALAQQGYNVNDPASMVVETAAKYLSNDLNGATPEQANQFLSTYFDEVKKAHGPNALDRLEKTRVALAQMQEQINGEHKLWSQRANSPNAQPSVPSVGAGPTPQVSPATATTANPIPEPVFQRSAGVETPTATPTPESVQREANFRDPNNWIAAGAREFLAREGRTMSPHTYSPLDFRSKEIADAYNNMQHNPNDPKVKAAYDSMKADIDKQWDYATQNMGIKFDPSKENPYANSQEMVNDVKNNHHLSFYQGGDMPSDHPLAQVDPKTGLTYNDKLRAIHDLFGHAMEGYQFGPRGEENAWISHAQMFSPESLPAVTTETKGQNSWVNAGPHLRDANGNIIQPGQPGYIPPPQRPFAEQKAGLLPDRFHYRNDAPVSFISPNTMDLSLPEAQQRMNSVIQKRFAGASRDLANQLGLQPSVRPALGSWEGGAENSVIHQFPVGTDPDMVRYYNSILGKLGYQYSTGSFFPGEGADHVYLFWTDKGDTAGVAKTLLDHGIQNSTIEPADGGHVIYLVGSGDDFRGNVDQAAKVLGHTGEIEDHAGTAEFPGNSSSRDAAARDFSAAAEALESKHPEWKQIREGFESRPDINSLRQLIQSTHEVTDPTTGVVHYSNTPGIDQLDPSYYGQNKTHDVSGSVIDRPDLRRKQSFPTYWNPETYVGEEASPAFHDKANERFSARNYTYKGKVPTQGIYDLASDPDGILDLSRKELENKNIRKLGVRLQPSDNEVKAYAIKKLKDLGYSGRRDVNGLIASWDKIPVQDANVPPAADISQHLANLREQAEQRDPDTFKRTWKQISNYLTDDELGRYDTNEKQKKIVDAVNAMPSPEEWDAAVKAGISGKLWYERSSRAFDALVESQPDMFRKTDKEKFLNFVAALSPVQPVRANLLMAVNLWDKWNKAGRPVDVVWKDPKNFSGIASKNSSLYRILKGGRNTYGVDLPARMSNGIRALQDQPLSGPKVSAFAPNLGTDVARSTFKRDRRTNDALRKRIDEMSPDEMRHLLLHSHVVDLPNTRSFDEAEMKSPAPAVAMSDADGLKAFNDKFGYEAGNALLKAKADALKQAGLDAYHDKGDEFLYRGNSPDELKGKLEKAREILRNKVFDVTMDDGSTVQLKGVDFSYGVGKDLDEAESGQHSHKAVREARGERGPRGELGPITQIPKEDQVDQGAQNSTSVSKGPADLAALRQEAEARNPDTAFKREPQKYHQLAYVNPRSSLGLPNSAALVSSDGTVVHGKWHETLADDLGYDTRHPWEKKFFSDGGIRIRANKGEVNIEFGKDDPETLDRVRNTINSLRGSKFLLNFSGKDLAYWNGNKELVLQKLDDFENGRNKLTPQYGSAAYFRSIPDTAFKKGKSGNNIQKLDDVKAEAVKRSPTGAVAAAALSGRNQQNNQPSK